MKLLLGERSRMTARMRIGHRAERFVERRMKRRGFAILARNYGWKGGEIDLIGQRGELIVIMEVRFRHRENFVRAVDSVTPDKQRRIIRSAHGFLRKHPQFAHCTLRFDVAGVSRRGLLMTCDWVENAFSTELSSGHS